MCTNANGSQYVSPALWCTEMRTFDAARSRMRVERARGSVSTAQTRKIESAIESIVKTARSGWRKRFRQDEPRVGHAGARRRAAVHQHALVEPDHLVDEALRRAGRASP